MQSCWFVMVSAILLAGPLLAADPIILTDAQGEYPMGLHLDLLPDPQQQYTIEAVSDPAFAGQFTPSQKELPYLGLGVSSAWVRLTTRNHTARTKDWVLELRWHGYDVIELYLADPSSPGAWTVKRSGEYLPFGQREIKHRYQAGLSPAAAAGTDPDLLYAAGHRRGHWHSNDAVVGRRLCRK
jgi:hypothetical protein